MRSLYSNDYGQPAELTRVNDPWQVARSHSYLVLEIQSYLSLRAQYICALFKSENKAIAFVANDSWDLLLTRERGYWLGLEISFLIYINFIFCLLLLVLYLFIRFKCPTSPFLSLFFKPPSPAVCQRPIQNHICLALVFLLFLHLPFNGRF